MYFAIPGYNQIIISVLAVLIICGISCTRLIDNSEVGMPSRSSISANSLYSLSLIW